MLKIWFGKYYTVDGMPSISLECNFDFNGNELSEGSSRLIGYLNTFRDYRFQVSGSHDFSGSFGSTPVFDLYNWLVDGDGSKYTISAVACDATNAFVVYLSSVIYDTPIIPVLNPFCKISVSGRDEFIKFVDGVHKKFVERGEICEVPFDGAKEEKLFPRR